MVIQIRSMMVAAGALALGLASSQAMAADVPLPQVVTHNGRHGLMVDGQPFLMLGAQANNSSNYPAPLAKVWPTIEAMGANTLEIPVAWEQVEPREGQFDFSWLDTLLPQARAHGKRLVLLWFGTWKNSAPAYAPEWVKLNPKRFPHMIKPDGSLHYSMSPLGRETLAADKRAFVAMMRYLKDKDPQNTVIMVQVENETGSYGLVRDHASEAEKLFSGPAPEALLRRYNKPKGLTWAAAFGADADEYFQTWYLASYLGEIAAAGKTVKNLPMYANAALADPFKRQAATTYSAGGPVHYVIDIYKTAAPALDLVAPDIYNRDEKAVAAYLDHYNRADNALMVPEIGNDADYARHFWDMLGRGGIGFSPFGMDETGYFNYPLGARAGDGSVDAFGRIYHLFAPMQDVWAKAAMERKVWAAGEVTDPAAAHKSVIDMGKYRATLSYGALQFGFDAPKGNGRPSGGAAIAQLGPDEFLMTGFNTRVNLDLAHAEKGESLITLRVEEGHFDHGQWVFERVWNGDQIDYGYTFTNQPQVLRIRYAVQKSGATIAVGADH